MNKSTRYVVFALLFAVAGFGVYSLMNKSTSVETEVSTAVNVESSGAVEQADVANPAEVMGTEGEIKKEGEEVKPEIKKDGEVTPEESVLEEEETDEDAEQVGK